MIYKLKPKKKRNKPDYIRFVSLYVIREGNSNSYKFEAVADSHADNSEQAALLGALRLRQFERYDFSSSATAYVVEFVKDSLSNMSRNDFQLHGTEFFLRKTKDGNLETFLPEFFKGNC